MKTVTHSTTVALSSSSRSSTRNTRTKTRWPARTATIPPRTASSAPPYFPGDCTDCHWNYDNDDYGAPAYDVAYCDLNPDTSAVQDGVCAPNYDPATRFSQDDVCLGCKGEKGGGNQRCETFHVQHMDDVDCTRVENCKTYRQHCE